MLSYRDIKEIWNDIKNDKMMKMIARIFSVCVFIAFIITFIIFLSDGSKGKHSKYFFGLWERNIPKGYPDTIEVNMPVHDTIYIYGKKNPKLENKSSQNAEVISNSQSGGQTAKEITNNN